MGSPRGRNIFESGGWGAISGRWARQAFLWTPVMLTSSRNHSYLRAMFLGLMDFVVFGRYEEGPLQNPTGLSDHTTFSISRIGWQVPIAVTPAPSGPRLLRQYVCHQATTLRDTPAPFPAHDGYWAGHCQERLPSSRPAWAGAQGQQGIHLPCAPLPQLALTHYCVVMRPISRARTSVNHRDLPSGPAVML